MPTEVNDPGQDTIAVRFLRYERIQKVCTYIGGGIGGVLVIVGLNGTSIAHAPRWLHAVLITAVVLSAVCLGRAYIGYLSAQFHLARQQETGGLPDDRGVADLNGCAYPTGAYRSYCIAIALLAVAGIGLLAAVWWP